VCSFAVAGSRGEDATSPRPRDGRHHHPRPHTDGAVGGRRRRVAHLRQDTLRRARRLPTGRYIPTSASWIQRGDERVESPTGIYGASSNFYPRKNRQSIANFRIRQVLF